MFSVPSKPSNYSNPEYNAILGLGIFETSASPSNTCPPGSHNGCSMDPCHGSGGYQVCINGGSWEYDLASWGSTVDVAKSKFTTGTTYFTRWMIRDGGDGVDQWSSATQMTLPEPDNTAPTLTAKWPYPGCGNDGGAGGCYPSNGGTSRKLLQCSSVLELTFSEPVLSAAPGEWTWDPGLNPAYGLIQIYNVSVSGSYAQWNDAGGDSITVSGLGTNTLHLVVDGGMCVSSNPSDFGARVAPNALQDAAGNTFAGITGYGEWDWTIVNPPSNPSGQYSYPPGYSSP